MFLDERMISRSVNTVTFARMQGNAFTSSSFCSESLVEIKDDLINTVDSQKLAKISLLFDMCKIYVVDLD